MGPKVGTHFTPFITSVSYKNNHEYVTLVTGSQVELGGV